MQGNGTRVPLGLVVVLQWEDRSLRSSNTMSFVLQWDAHRRCACMAAMLLPLRLLKVASQKKSGGKKKGSEISASSHIILESLKLPKKDSEQVELLHSSFPELCRVYTAVKGASVHSW